MKPNLKFGFCLMMALIFLSACKKDDDFVISEFIVISEDLTTQQELLEDNELEITEQIETGLQSLMTRGFPTRSWSNTKGTYPNILTIDYGTAGVTSNNGRIRKGKIIVQLSAPITSTGAERIVSHEDFFIDDVKITGMVILTNQGQNALSQNLFLRTVTGRVLSFPTGKTIRWNALQTLTQLEGSNTPNLKSDDEWSILGTSSGVTRSGKIFNTSTPVALISRFSCPWIVKGISNLTFESNAFSIDFGDGTCNNAATLILPNGNTKEFYFRRWW
ncbi:MAG: hypothetical protein WBO31_09255 [Saprospiraceae bacterium]|nr:hypothetical protein [Saprospiraceae bacterium]